MSESSAAPDEKDKEAPKPTRRELIAGIAALVAGAAVASPKDAAANHTTMFHSQLNVASASTALQRDNLSNSVTSPAFVVQADGIGGGLYVEAGQLPNFAMTVSSAPVTFGVSALSDSTALVGGTGLNFALLRQNLLAVSNHPAGMFAFSNTAGVPASVAFHGADVQSIPITVTAAAMYALSSEDDGVAVRAEHGNSGVALHVIGDAVFDGNVFGTGSGVPVICRRFTVPANTMNFIFNDASIDSTTLLVASLNGKAGTNSAPAFITHVVSENGRGRAIFNKVTVNTVNMTVIGFRPCPMS